ncbi:MAG: alpha/beta hydrolase [Pseudomonadota bacterium]
MTEFVHDGVKIAYLDEGPGDGAVVLCIHGFASNKSVNWVGPGWVQTLVDAGFRVIAHDNRGHGDSDKPHSAENYAPEVMADDAAALLGHLSVNRANVMGYSMGARIAAFMAFRHPELIDKLVFGGLGIGMVEGVGDWDPIADALLADSLDDVTHERGRMFRAFADQTGSDRMALAACISASRTLLTPAQMAQIAAETLIAVGTKDDIAGAPHSLAAMMPNATALDIAGRDHMLAVGDRQFKAGVLALFANETPIDVIV